MFKPIYELLTSPLGLPIAWYYEYLILVAIDAIAYHFAFSEVGGLYRSGMIGGSTAGSFFHWIIRALLFFVMWAVAYGVIWLGKFVMANWQIILMSVVGIVGISLVCILTITIMRKIKQHRTVNANV